MEALAREFEEKAPGKLLAPLNAFERKNAPAAANRRRQTDPPGRALVHSKSYGSRRSESVRSTRSRTPGESSGLVAPSVRPSVLLGTTGRFLAAFPVGLAALVLGIGAVAGAPHVATADESEPAGTREELGRSSSGHVYWCGHKLSPPYVFDFVNGEVEVNGLPLRLPRPERVIDSTLARVSQRKHELLEQAIEGSRRLKASGVTDTDSLRGAQAVILESAPELVDSAKVIDGELHIYWRGSGAPEVSMTRPSRKQKKSLIERQRDMVQEYLWSLEFGICLSFTGRGHSRGGRHSAPMFQAQLDSLRAGHRLSAPPLLFQKRPDVVQRLLSPVPIEELRNGTEH